MQKGGERMASIETNYNLVNTFFGTGASYAYNIPSIGKTTATKNDSYASNSASLSGNSDASEYLKSLKSGSKALSDSMSQLLAKSNSIFNQKTAKSSNEDIIGIKAGNVKQGSGNDDAAYKIEVEQLAKTQKNIGNTLNSNEKSFSSDRYYGYSIESEGKTHDFAFSVNPSETNDDVLKRMAKDINSRNIGITATVTYDAFNKKSSLVLESNKTGESLVNGQSSDAFKVTSRNGYADVADMAGIKEVDQRSQDALYRINDGDMLSSKSNDITLSNGATVTLKKEGTANIASEKSSTSAINATREMINGFNKLYEAAKSMKDSDSGANRLFEELNGLAKTYSKSLATIGVSTNENGFLTINEDAMKKAGESGALESFFDSKEYSSYGFANRLSNTVSKINSDATNYLGLNGKESIKATDDNYSNSRDNSEVYISPFKMNKMAQYNNIGMLFDSMF